MLSLGSTASTTYQSVIVEDDFLLELLFFINTELAVNGDLGRIHLLLLELLPIVFALVRVFLLFLVVVVRGALLVTVVVTVGRGGSLLVLLLLLGQLHHLLLLLLDYVFLRNLDVVLAMVLEHAAARRLNHLLLRGVILSGARVGLAQA